MGCDALLNLWRNLCQLPVSRLTGKVPSSKSTSEVSAFIGTYRACSDCRIGSVDSDSLGKRLILRALTFPLLARPSIHPMRRTSIASALLILVLTTSVSACAAQWCRQPETSCRRLGARQACARKKPATATVMHLPCGPFLKSTPGQCGMRSFVQFQLVVFHAFEITPRLRMASSISTPFDSLIIVSSIGSPETDRGPPIS